MASFPSSPTNVTGKRDALQIDLRRKRRNHHAARWQVDCGTAKFSIRLDRWRLDTVKWRIRVDDASDITLKGRWKPEVGHRFKFRLPESPVVLAEPKSGLFWCHVHG
ncbi:hypothetical protein R3P38DRAFT_3376904 [Favolaschia claudopus]|uniref:Uncharacterized protein n=1 Tax=Favolaschia claudopus TaxID=2862362 RepID=A0AAV9ZDC2_9AGAR